ncbi:hypothetical protein [Noviherbaspirillum sp. ST9]|uniref:hypothetical protein n=1 Tax=Noviherbaspirillum sp. ST9 TaxID=3401606 RepID=UPI003B586DDE
MTALLIKDLSTTTELDATAMSAVRGGTCYTPPSCYLPSYCAPSYGKPHAGLPVGDFKFNAAQSIGQVQNVENNNGNNVAFASGITSTVNPTQTANNSINF